MERHLQPPNSPSMVSDTLRAFVVNGTVPDDLKRKSRSMAELSGAHRGWVGARWPLPAMVAVGDLRTPRRTRNQAGGCSTLSGNGPVVAHRRTATQRSDRGRAVAELLSMGSRPCHQRARRYHPFMCDTRTTMALNDSMHWTHTLWAPHVDNALCCAVR